MRNLLSFHTQEAHLAYSGTGEEANDECVHNKIKKFNQDSNQSALIIWDATDMDNLMENADVNDAGLDEDTLGLQ